MIGNSRNRRGGATLLVIVAVLGLSMTVYAFANFAFLEHASARGIIRQTQLRMCALSALDSLRQRMEMGDRIDRQSLVHFGLGKQKASWGTEAGHSFDLFREISKSSFQVGLVSDSSKLNIHSLDLSRKSESLSRARLCSLPGVTPQMADALLDWIDADDEPRAFGAEANWYLDSNSNVKPPNHPIRDWNELVYIRGFNEQIVFGEDANNNGWTDWNENDGDAELPIDDRDGILKRGLVQYITLNSFESNYNTQNQLKINLNDNDLSRLYDAVASSYGQEVAKFIVAYRLDGPIRKEVDFDPKNRTKSIADTFEERIEKQVGANEDQPEVRGNSTAKTTVSSSKGGLALGRKPVFQIRSMLDLLNVSVVTLVDTEERIFESPWKSTGTDTHKMLIDLEDRFTTVEGDRLLGRIDITQASREVLLTVPGMTAAIADAIVRHRESSLRNGPNACIPSVYWLVENQIVDIDLLRNLAVYLTTSGAVCSGYAVGQDKVSQSSVIIQFTLSLEGKTVRFLMHREIGVARMSPQGIPNARLSFQ